MEYKGVERRACERFAVPGATASFREEGFSFFQKKFSEFYPVIDISRGGVRVVSDIHLRVNAAVSLKLTVPDEDPLTLKGRVMWVSMNPEGSYKYQIGVQFNPYGSKRGENSTEALESMIGLEQRFLRQGGTSRS